MKSLVQLWSQLAAELGDLCGIDTRRDILSMSRRVEDEGDAFLRITLPSFGKAFDKALDEGMVSSGLFPGFRRKGGLPLFLGGFLQRVFDSKGKVLDDPCVESIRSVRQLCHLMGKIRGDCSPSRNRKAVDGFIKSDDACAVWDETHPSELLDLSRVGRLLLGWLLSKANNAVRTDNLVPRHGPGSTADGLLGNEKYDVAVWPPNLDSRFPWDEWAIINARFDEYWPEASTPSLEPVAAKLRLVPKTLATPRVIVKEPTAMQYMQQAIMAVMVESIESQSSLIGFADQEVNRSMARSASKDGSLATIDLSEASDRVSLGQVKASFAGVPDLLDALLATRSDRVLLPLGEIREKEISRFASMGSAVCFPVEACVFLCALLLAVERHHRKSDSTFSLTYGFLKGFEGRMRVYGDDIIVPVEYLPEVQEVFTSLGWIINTNKSFAKGFLRESCGGEYWNGEDVTPVRVRSLIPTRLQETSEMNSLCSLRNQLYQAGYWRTASFLDSKMERLTRGIYPIVPSNSSALGRHSCCFTGLTRATNGLQQHLVRAYVISTPSPSREASEHGAFIKCLTVASVDSEHLLKSGRGAVSYIKRRWIPLEQRGAWYGSRLDWSSLA